MTSVKCDDDGCNLLLLVKTTASFSLLYSKMKWPNRLGGESFTVNRRPAIPPQLAVILTNVTRYEVLNSGYAIVNYIKYDVREYLTQATKRDHDGYNSSMAEQNGIIAKLDLILNSINQTNGVIDDLAKRTERIETWLGDKQKFNAKIDNERQEDELSRVLG